MTARHYGLQGRGVLITGAAGGIGQALSRAFADQGARLVLLDREATALARLCAELSDRTEVVEAVCDLGDDAAVSALAQRLAQRWGRLDVLLHNAGVEYPTPLDDTAPDANARWSALLDNNVTGMLRLTRALLALLPQGASVIHQSSIWGHVGVAGFSAYVASKHAVIGLTRSLALELGPRGVRVNAVCPGWVRTGAALRSLDAMAQARGRSAADVEHELLARQAVPQMLGPQDLADVFLFLACDGSAALTGQSLSLSHGEVML